MGNLAKELGEKIRQARKSKGLSQDVFALICQVDRSYMGRIERGEVDRKSTRLNSSHWE